VTTEASGERYVLLGLAPPRSPWFRELSRWTTSASLAAEFVKCVSAEEVRARLGSGRVHSALIVDMSSPAFDRDLVATAGAAFTPVIAVDDAHRAGWPAEDLGVAAVLGSGFTLDELVDVLAGHTRPIGRGDGLPPRLVEEPAAVWRGQLVAVCGPGGTGASTAAAALAQGLAADPRFGRRVLLADLALRADQAMLHDAPELGPGLQEVVEAHRLGRPTPDDLRQSTFDIPRRGYQLLLGLRRSAAWSALRPRAVEASVDGLRRAWQVVVADVTGDVEGEEEGGSADVEERNALARTATSQADVVVVVGRAGLKGTHSLTGLVQALIGHGVDPARLLPVINVAPRGPRSHAEVAGALADLLGVDAGVSNPVFVPERRVEEAFRDGLALPAAVCDPLVGGVRAILDRVADRTPAATRPAAITPGSLGSWSEEDADAS
jgi:hypothetical protein